jgi:hypothetical protein
LQHELKAAKKQKADDPVDDPPSEPEMNTAGMQVLASHSVCTCAFILVFMIVTSEAVCKTHTGGDQRACAVSSAVVELIDQVFPPSEYSDGKRQRIQQALHAHGVYQVDDCQEIDPRYLAGIPAIRLNRLKSLAAEKASK